MIANDIRMMQRLSVQECSYYNFELNTKGFYYILRNNDPLEPNIKKVLLDPRLLLFSTLSSSVMADLQKGIEFLAFLT